MKKLFWLLLLLAGPAAAQSNVVRIVVPFAAGGVQDIVARSFNAELGVGYAQGFGVATPRPLEELSPRFTAAGAA